VELEKKDVVWARHGFDELLKAHSVSIKFTEDGSKKIEKLTKRMAGKRLAILLDGKVVSAPIIEAELSETAILSGLKKEDALKLAKALDAK
jgi:preprotein translocase subunit SecD